MSVSLLSVRRPVATARYVGRKVFDRLRKGRIFAPRYRPEVPPELPAGAIDVRDLIASATVEEHLVRADAYFSSLRDWTWHLAKPFGSPADAPHLLMQFGEVLQGMQLAPGMRVLDFGAGTGWTSRWLSQMGCDVICCDVSPAALEIAKQLYASHPPFGKTPPPAFVVFDGRRLDLPDASVDRILCFDAFHHAPNPDEVLAEMARVLRDGGIASFCEPGPYHSRTVQSQYEMKTHGVIENDVDIHAIAARATELGFTSLTMSASYQGAHHIPLSTYEDLMHGGEPFVQWAEAARRSMNDKRMFFMTKGEAKADSRQTKGLAGTVRLLGRSEASAGAPIHLDLEITNSGEVEWLPSGARPGGVSVGAHLTAADGGERIHDWVWADLADDRRTVAVGETVAVTMETPPLEPGSWNIEVGLVSDGVAWFEQLGCENVRFSVDV